MLKQAHALTEEIIEWRRDFHMHPEIGFDVQRTAGIVADELEKLGYRVRRGVGKTGVVADLGEGSPLVAIRADMDALPLQEMNDSEYKSTYDGKMHACGHDSHTAMALAAATIFAKEKFPGTVRFLFQPAEEVADEEGKSGAHAHGRRWRGGGHRLRHRPAHRPADHRSARLASAQALRPAAWIRGSAPSTAKAGTARTPTKPSTPSI